MFRTKHFHLNLIAWKSNEKLNYYVSSHNTFKGFWAHNSILSPKTELRFLLFCFSGYWLPYRMVASSEYTSSLFSSRSKQYLFGEFTQKSKKLFLKPTGNIPWVLLPKTELSVIFYIYLEKWEALSSLNYPGPNSDPENRHQIYQDSMTGQSMKALLGMEMQEMHASEAVNWARGI